MNLDQGTTEAPEQRSGHPGTEIAGPKIGDHFIARGPYSLKYGEVTKVTGKMVFFLLRAEDRRTAESIGATAGTRQEVHRCRC